MFYVHSLLSTWVFHCSIWMSQKNICEHICFDTKRGRKIRISSPPGRGSSKTHFLPFQPPSCIVSLSAVRKAQRVWGTIAFDPQPIANSEHFTKGVLSAGLSASFKQRVPFQLVKFRECFLLSFVLSKSQIGLKSIYFICHECLVGRRQCIKSIIHIKTPIKQIINCAL